MQSFHRQLQVSTCYDKQTQAKEEEKFQDLRKAQQRAKCPDCNKNPKVRKKNKRRKTEKEENRKGAPVLSKMQISDDESKKSVSSLT